MVKEEDIFFRKKVNSLEYTDLLYPINYIGEEKDEKSVYNKIIAKILLPNKIEYSEEFGEIITFQEGDESVTYVVSRKPFFTKEFLKKIKNKEFFKTLFDKKNKESFIDILSNLDLLVEEQDFKDLYTFLNDGIKIDCGEDEECRWKAKKNVYHRLCSFFKDDKDSKDMIENILINEDYKML